MMLREIQVNKDEQIVYAMDENYDVIAKYPCGTAYYAGYNDNGEPYGNAPEGVYDDENVWAEAKGQYANEPPYGWGYLNLDPRGRAIHGGGSNLDDPYAPYQNLTPTYGCYRMHNADIYHLCLMFLDAQEKGFKPVVTVV